MQGGAQSLRRFCHNILFGGEKPTQRGALLLPLSLSTLHRPHQNSGHRASRMKKPPALPPLWFEHVHNAPGGVAAAKGLRLHLDKMLRRGCWAAKGEERRSVEKGKGEVPRELTKDFDLRRQNFDQKYLDGEPSQRGWACDGATSQAIAGFELINALSEKVTMFSKSSLTNQKVQKWNKTIIVKHFLN